MSDRNDKDAEQVYVEADEEPVTIQQRVEGFFNDSFGKWGVFLSKYPCRVFWLSMLFFILLSAGLAKSTGFEDEQLVWTPSNNPSIQARDKGSKLFPSKGAFIGLLAEVKNPSGASATIITSQALKDLNDFQDKLNTVKATVGDKEVTWSSICIKRGPDCQYGESMLTFGMNSDEKLESSYFANDQALLDRVKTGKGGRHQGNGDILEIAPMFGGTDPATVTQDSRDGINDIKSAKATVMAYPYVNGEFDKDQLAAFEQKVEEAARAFNKESGRSINVYIFSANGLQESFSGDMQSDLKLVQVSITLVATYCIIFIGGCSPIHFRSAAAGIALLCVGLSFASSNGLAYLLGGKSAGIHSLLPFLLIGIGVDDVFVISAAIDQTNARWPVEKRMREGLKHAGSSITITSLTNAIAFFLGCAGSLDALSSFCFFAGLGILMLYLTSMTVFSSFMVWELRRQSQKKGDCCGLCSCKEDTIICCKGYFLTEAQRSYPFQGEESDPVPKEKYATSTQKFLYLYFSRASTSRIGIALILITWLVVGVAMVYGVTQLKIDFKATYFISPTSYIRNYVDKRDQYFKLGEKITVFTDSKDIDMTSPTVQKRLKTFNEKLKKCEGCSQKFTVEESFDSWYVSFAAYSQSKTNENGHKCKASWNPGEKVIVSDKFMPCLDSFLRTPGGGAFYSRIKMNKDKTKIIGFKQNINSVYIADSANEGVKFLLETRSICDNANLGDTYAFEQRFFDYETYVVFKEEAIQNVSLALVAVLVVMLIVTANVPVTLFILLCIALVDLFLLGLLWYWNITLNSVTVVNNVIAVGLAVDYSAHIGHAFLMVDPPDADETGKALTNHEKRIYKARGALSSMGSSVFHGAFSTFLAIVVLAPSKSYIFISFFKMWFGIIVFGVAHGFILLPVLLALCGPLNQVPKTVEQNQVKAELHAIQNRSVDKYNTEAKVEIELPEERGQDP